MSRASLASWSARRHEGAQAPIALGTMNFGKRTSEAVARSIIDRAFERGINFLDTANVYNDGESERVVGRAVHGRRDQFLIATKVGFGRRGEKPEGLSRGSILEACDESLARLATDYIDVYYLHKPDPQTPIAETVQALGELLARGKIKAWAVSNFASWQVLEAQHACREKGIAAPILSQVLYNLVVRQLDVEYFRFAAHTGVHTTIYNPLAGGMLTGRYQQDAKAQAGSRFDNALYRRRYWTDRMFELVEAYRKIADEEGMSLTELAYAWAAGQSGVDSILIGPGSIEHLDAGIEGCQKAVSSGARERIDAIHLAYLGTDASYAR